MKVTVYTSNTEVIVLAYLNGGVHHNFGAWFGPGSGRNVEDYNIERRDLQEGLSILPSLRVK